MAALRSLRQEDHQFEASLGYTGSSGLAWATEKSHSDKQVN